ncbi:hypothetical protein [Microcoleus sp. herbarium12]|uniref:hypothetical protein n=1 Tax=Microcoleus sp. herbarium12 TaxID=3055437 RepID=UPI002FD369BF
MKTRPRLLLQRHHNKIANVISTIGAITLKEVATHASITGGMTLQLLLRSKLNAIAPL